MHVCVGPWVRMCMCVCARADRNRMPILLWATRDRGEGQSILYPLPPFGYLYILPSMALNTPESFYTIHM